MFASEVADVPSWESWSTCAACVGSGFDLRDTELSQLLINNLSDTFLTTSISLT